MFVRKFFGNKKAIKGFTLVEIIVVLIILAILAAATIPSLLGFIDDAKFKTIDNEANVVRNAAQAYATECSAKGKSDEDIQNGINGVINSEHALHYLLQNDASGTVFMAEVKDGKIKKFNYTKEIIEPDKDYISNIRYVMFDDTKSALLHATDPVTNINIDDFEARIIEKVTASLTSDQPSSLKSSLATDLNSSLESSVTSLTTNLNSSLESGMNSKIDNLKTNFKTELGSDVIDLIYPVGSYYVSHSSTSPETLFGGKWSQITDRFLYCANSSGSTGGSNSYNLTSAQLPAHTHGAGSYSAASNGAHTHLICKGYTRIGSTSSGGYVCWGDEGYASMTRNTGSAGAHTHSISGTSGATGSGNSINNMPAYTTVYCWRRTK